MKHSFPAFLSNVFHLSFVLISHFLPTIVTLLFLLISLIISITFFHPAVICKIRNNTIWKCL